MSAYDPITYHLRQVQGRTLRMSFADIERIISRPLPPSAYKHREWWANNPSGHSHARSWAAAGWRTEKVDLEKRELFFAKDGSTPAGPAPAPGDAIPDPFGAMRGTVTFFPGIDLTEPTGEVWEAESDDVG